MPNRDIHTHAPEDTCDRLLDAAEILFAEKGFASTSVREITAAADCNVAAVNYHFRGKNALYEEVFRRRLRAIRKFRIGRVREAMQEAGDQANVETVVRSFSEAFLEPLLSAESGGVALRLIMQEMLNPRLPEGLIREEMAEPTLKALVSALLGLAPELSEEQAVGAMHSLIGQLLHVVHGSRLNPKGLWSDSERMKEHIIHFTIGGIESFRLSGKGSAS